VKAVILAAGKSTRLQPLTNNCPKPMLKVCGKPMLEHIISQLAHFGFREIIITTHFVPEKIVAYFGNGARWGVNITYANEPELMNTAGSLRLIKHLLVDDFLVIGGNDFLPEINLNRFLMFHSEGKQIDGHICTIAFKRMLDHKLAALFGQGVLDLKGQLICFQEKPAVFLSEYVHTTYQIYTADALGYIPEKTPFAIPNDLIPALLGAGKVIRGYITESPFICISSREQYEHAQIQIAAYAKILKERAGT